MSTQATVKILCLAANPHDITRLQIDEEMRAIDQALRMTEHRERFDLRSHWAVRYGDLQELLLRYQPHVVHFSGHGSPDGEIILQSDSGAHPASAKALSSLFAILKDNLHCVVLNSCYSEVQAQAIAKHTDCVIGMADAIGDMASINFASAFYRALGYGRSIQAAFDLGCNAIDLANLADQEIPQLLALHANPTQVVLIPSNVYGGKEPSQDKTEFFPYLSSIQNLYQKTQCFFKRRYHLLSFVVTLEILLGLFFYRQRDYFLTSLWLHSNSWWICLTGVNSGYM